MPVPGQQEVLGPDSYDYKCTTKLTDGRKYLDLITCFDAPPYEDLDSCTEATDYPRKPPRALP